MALTIRQQQTKRKRMSGLTRKDLQFVCRTCLAKLKNKVHYPMMGFLTKWIHNFTSIDVRKESSEYPKFVCDQCYDIFKDLNSFQQLVRRTEKTLHAVLGKNKNINTELKEIKKYRISWETNDTFKDWITPCVEDNSMAHCSYCRSDVSARYKDLIRHSQTHKHKHHSAIAQSTQKQFEVSKKPIVDSKLEAPNLDHSAEISDNEDIIMKIEMSDDDLNENDTKKCNKQFQTESSRNNLLHLALNEPYLEQSRLVSEDMHYDGEIVIKTEIPNDKISSKEDNNAATGDPLTLNGESYFVKIEEASSEDGNNSDDAVGKDVLNSEFNVSNLEQSSQTFGNTDEIMIKTEIPDDNLKEDNEKNCGKCNETSKTKTDTNVMDLNIEYLTELDDDDDDEAKEDVSEYNCEKCSLYYDNKYYCILHKQLTHELRTTHFICEICSSSYSMFVNLDRHMREIHNIFVRPYKCEYRKCNSRFQDWPQRIKHYHEYHHQIKAERMTSSLKVLKYEKNLFICIVCNKQYASLDDIRLHTPTHGDDLKFVCGICGDRNDSQWSLNKHYVLNHMNPTLLCGEPAIKK